MKILTAVLCIAFAVGVVACGPAAGIGSSGAQPTATVIRNTSIKDYTTLVNALRQSGLSVDVAGDVSQPFFSAQGRSINVNGETVQVFEYADEQAMQSDAAKVGGDGFHVANAVVDWTAPPHFYKQGRLIVLYVGHETRVKSALDFVLGPQFAGQDNKSAPTPSAPTPLPPS